MNWSEFPLNPGGRTLRQFGGAWLAFFSVLGAYHYFARAHHSLGLALGLMAFLVGLPGLVQPRLVKWVFVVSTLLAFPIGWVVSQLALVAMFFGTLSPLACWFGLRGRDALFRKQPAPQDSYWLPKETNRDVKSYFREY